MTSMAYGFEEKCLDAAHKVTLEGRSKLNVTGVSDVDNFDEAIVTVHTVRGSLVIRGSDLHLQMLSLESSQVCVEGEIDSLVYENDTASGGFFSRLFR
jgi:sporulation protein YabP